MEANGARSDFSGWGAIHDVLLFYSKGPDYIWNPQFQNYDEEYLDSKYTNKDERGRFMPADLTGAGLRQGDSGKPWKEYDPSSLGRHWIVNREVIESLVGTDMAASMTTQEKLDKLNEHTYIYWPTRGRNGEGGFPRFKHTLGKA